MRFCCGILVHRMNDKHQYWFPAKRYGWGWGLPTAWQGWVVFLVWIAVFAALAVAVPSLSLRYHPVEHALFVVGMIGLLVLICYWKGEPPRWR